MEDLAKAQVQHEGWLLKRGAGYGERSGISFFTTTKKSKEEMVEMKKKRLSMKHQSSVREKALGNPDEEDMKIRDLLPYGKNEKKRYFVLFTTPSHPPGMWVFIW